MALLYTSDLALESGWTLATQTVTPDTAFFYSLTNAPMYSCPDFFAVPGSTDYAFLSLDEAVYVGEYVPTLRGGPRFRPARTKTTRYLQGDTHHEPLSIMKTGGVGPNNAASDASRRLYFGTVGWPNVNVPQLNASIPYPHTGSVVSLPREISAGPAFAFPRELEALRVPNSRSTELVLE